MKTYETHHTKFHLDADEAYRVLRTLSYCNEKIKMRQFDSDKVSFGDFAEHLKGEDIVINVSIFDREKVEILNNTALIRVEFLARKGRFAYFEGAFKDIDYEKFVTSIELAIRYVDFLEGDDYEDICKKNLSIGFDSNCTVFNFFNDSSILLPYKFTCTSCYLKFESRPLEFSEKKMLGVTTTNE